MTAYEFSTIVSESGKVSVPRIYKRQIPKGKPVRVVIWVEEAASEDNVQPPTIARGTLDESLEELIARIQRTPLNPALATPASGLLAEHLANPVSEPDSDFNEAEWNQQWAAIEAKMDALETTKETPYLADLTI